MDFLYCKEKLGEEKVGKKIKSIFGGVYYYTKGIGLTIETETIGVKGYIRGWTLALASGEVYTGTTKEEFIEKIHTLWPDLKHCSKTTKEKVVIYTDEIRKIQGFFQKEITNSFEDLKIEIDDFYEIRPCKRWFDFDKKKNDALFIAQQIQKTIDMYFISEKHFYLTPQQRNRKILEVTKGDDDTATLSYPPTYDKYKTIRKAYFSGLLYTPFCGAIDEPMLVLDITSSYIFDLLIEKQVVSKQLRVKDLSMWEYYLSSSTKISLGCYKIKYAAPRTFVNCYTDVEGNKLEAGEHEVTMVLTNIDIQNLFNLGYIRSIEPIWLYEYEAAELPEYYRDALVEAYIAKATAVNKKEKAIRKPILNGFYGDTIRRYDKEEDFWNTRINPILSPLWGICTTAYAKKYLLKLALKIDGWYYSDTDSIICKDTPQNRKYLEEFNNEIRSMVKAFCDEYNYDFDILKNLGTFKIEAEIKKLKVWTTKTYCYKKLNGEVELKAAGLVKDNIAIDDTLFYMKELDYTRYSFPTVVKAKDGEEGYYAEITPKNKAQFHLMMKKFMTTSKLADI